MEMQLCKPIWERADMRVLDKTIHTGKRAPCFSATPFFARRSGWRTPGSTLARKQAAKNHAGAYWPASGGLIGQQVQDAEKHIIL